MRRLLTAAVLALAVAAQTGRAPAAAAAANERDWPAAGAEAKPWTRWWWHGSAVDRGSLAEQLATLRDAGLGGVEITPIYGIRGEERHFIPYLSPEWTRMLEHTVATAQGLGLGVDIATGTGWPFGGPRVTDDTASRSLAHRTWTLSAGERLAEPIRMQQEPFVRAIGNQIHVVNEGAPGDPPRAPAGTPVVRPGARAVQIADLVQPVSANRNLQELALEQVKFPRELPLAALVAYGDAGEVLDLTSRVSGAGRLAWTPPSGTWTLYGVFGGWHGKMVERAAPGGEGYVIDHFSASALDSYLAAFDRAFARARLTGLRAFFNDSYEVDDATGQADWTPGLFEEFRKRRGYDLRHHLPALFGRADGETGARVLSDYRETMSDLLLESFTTRWTRWAHGMNTITRNQAHGSPANLLDLYAASDVPETEGAELQRFKWASSAGNVAGRRLVSAEAATWLGEHFRTTLADVHAAVDRFFAGGVNHIVYHGTAYSPRGEAWPGRLFYASVAFAPQQPWWEDFAALNAYVTRTQSLLQRGRADHDVLLYFPFHEAASARGPALLAHFGGANPPARGTRFESAAAVLQSRGFTYDFVSDRQLRKTGVNGGRLVTEGGGEYRVIVLPAAAVVPLETLERVLDLARRGATVVAFGGWPGDVAGHADLSARRARMKTLTSGIALRPPDASGIREARAGAGRVLAGDDLPALLERTGIVRERLVDRGLVFARRADGQGRIYFVSNPTDRHIDDWIPLATSAPAVTVFDAMTGRKGAGRTRRAGDGHTEVYLQIPAGESRLLAPMPAADAGVFGADEPAGSPIALEGPWSVAFVKGGPTLPPSRALDRLVSWTGLGDEEARFSGSAVYTATFPRPPGTADLWRLDLGSVHESARVRVNGRDVGTLIGAAFGATIGTHHFLERNRIEVTVTNLSANRIADLDRRGVPWKKFYNVNFPARFADNRGADGLFTAAAWTPLPSGLLGPVTLTPLRRMR